MTRGQAQTRLGERLGERRSQARKRLRELSQRERDAQTQIRDDLARLGGDAVRDSHTTARESLCDRLDEREREDRTRLGKKLGHDLTGLTEEFETSSGMNRAETRRRPEQRHRQAWTRLGERDPGTGSGKGKETTWRQARRETRTRLRVRERELGKRDTEKLRDDSGTGLHITQRLADNSQTQRETRRETRR